MKFVARGRKRFRGKEGERFARKRIWSYVEDKSWSLTPTTEALTASQQISHEYSGFARHRTCSSGIAQIRKLGPAGNNGIDAIYW